MAKCGLGHILIGPERDAGTRDGRGIDDRLKKGTYSTKYPVAWYGQLGWRFFDTKKRDIRHWIPGAPYNQPADLTVYETRQQLEELERKRMENQEKEKTERQLDAEASIRAGRQRPMGLLHIFFYVPLFQKAIAWFSARPIFTASLYWLALIGICIALEYASTQDIIHAVSGFWWSIGLGIIQSIPILSAIVDAVEFAEEVLAIFKKPVLFWTRIALLPLIVASIIIHNPNRTKAFLNVVAIALLGIMILGGIMDIRWFGLKSLREVVIRGGRNGGIYSTFVLIMGGWIIPVLLLMLLQRTRPLDLIWMFDNMEMLEISLHLLRGALIGAVISFLIQLQARRDAHTFSVDMETSGGTADTDDLGGMQAEGRKMLLKKSMQTSEQIKALILGLVINITAGLLVNEVCPLRGAVERTRMTMNKTLIWRQ